MLKPEDLEKAKLELERLRDELTAELARIPDVIDFGEEGSEMDPNGPEADETEREEVQSEIKDAIRARLEDVKSALIKVATGRYGTCETCGGEIEAEIRAIDPESRYCAQCKKTEASAA